MKRNILAVLTAFILFTVIGTLFLHGGRILAMDIHFNVKDLPEHGLRIILPTDPSFDVSLASKTLPNVSPDLFRPLSVFVQNTAQKSAVAYMLRWEFTYTNGKTVHYDHHFASPAFLMEAWESGKHIEHQGYNINPNSIKLFSLIPPEKNDQRAIGGYSGFAMNQSEESQGLDEKNSRERSINALAEELTHVTSITVSIDGTFFDDGTFVGPDNTNFFAKFKAQYDARRDLYNEILHRFQSKESGDKIFEYVEGLSRGDVKAESTMSIADVYSSKDVTDSNDVKSVTYSIAREYNNLRRMYARELVRHIQRVGTEKAIETIQSRVAKPWAPLRKLQ